MKTHFLFPNSFKKIGCILFVPTMATILYIWLIDSSQLENLLEFKVFALYKTNILGASEYLVFIKNHLIDELLTILLMISLLFVGFSKTKSEDEMIEKIRYESLVWATYFNLFLLLFNTIFFYGLFYGNFIILNIFSQLLFFIIRFHYKIYQLNKATHDDE
ncbi:hypothetical protein [Flavobacterium sp.]|uniref:hypothetical protein n=1 Tax=Flavobacterium sp. TaxID=239 RepID=UPI002609CEFC|nr:hypothetical protein [Flavobacterium sp.]